MTLRGGAHTAEVVLPGFVATGSGHLIGLSSLAASPDAPGYAASRAGLTNYFGGLALAMRRHGVAVTSILFVDTKMAKSSIKPGLMSPRRWTALPAWLGVRQRHQGRYAGPI